MSKFVDYPSKIVQLCKESGKTVRAPEIKMHFSGQPGGKADGFRAYRDELLIREPEIREEFKGGVLVATPKTSVIQTGCHEEFQDRNKLSNFLEKGPTDAEIMNTYLKAHFSKSQKREFLKVLSHHVRPIIPRSSSISEDSERANFAGIFSSVFLPNQSDSIGTRLAQLEYGVKLIYASSALSVARAYRKAAGMVTQDLMAVMVQNVAGRKWRSPDGIDLYYPELSYAAFSFNDYAPRGHKSIDGVMRAAFGLGEGVVGGLQKTAVRVNLGKPRPLVGMSDTKSILRASPEYFFALELSDAPLLPDREDFFIKRLKLDKSAEFSLLKFHTSTYYPENDRIYAGYSRFDGSSVYSFPLVFDPAETPVVPAMRYFNGMLTDLFGMHVDHEGAIDSVEMGGKKYWIFYPLQARAQVRVKGARQEKLPAVSEESIIFQASNAMGRGDYDVDIVVHVPYGAFSAKNATFIGNEIREINQKLEEAGKKYVFFTPGRFGNMEPEHYCGLPGTIDTISSAQAVFEYIPKEWGFDGSQGSHMFEALSSLGIALAEHGDDDGIAHRVAKHASSVENGKYAKIYSFTQPLKMLLDKQDGLLLFKPQK